MDGSCGKLTFLTDKCFSWAVQEEKGDDKRVKGHKLPILVISRDEQGVLKATEKQNEFLELWTNLVAMAKKFCMQNAESMGRFGLDPLELKKIGNCLFVKKDAEGKPEEGKSPTLYTKVKCNPKTGVVFTRFHKMRVKRGEDPSIDMKELIGKRCELMANLHFESIFVNSSHITIQVKVLEVGVFVEKPQESVIPVEVVEEEEEDY